MSERASLDASFLPMTRRFGRAAWVMHLEERAFGLALPDEWRAALTPREQEVAGAVLKGWDNRLIGAELGCSPNTVKKHLQNVFDKLGVGDRAALLVRAAQDRGRTPVSPEK